MRYKEMMVKFIVPSDVEGYHLEGMLNVVLGENEHCTGGWRCSETRVYDSQLMSDETIILFGEERK